MRISNCHSIDTCTNESFLKAFVSNNLSPKWSTTKQCWHNLKFTKSLPWIQNDWFLEFNCSKKKELCLVWKLWPLGCISFEEQKNHRSLDMNLNLHIIFLPKVLINCLEVCENSYWVNIASLTFKTVRNMLPYGYLRTSVFFIVCYYSQILNFCMK